MLNSLEDAIGKSCLIGLTYFDLQGEELKQSLLAGVVKSVDQELGITLRLLQASKVGDIATQNADAEFIIPANLACWFKAPKGEFGTSQAGVKVKNPDFLITWDIHQTKKEVEEGQQQWWEWVPRTVAPVVGN